MYSWSSLAEKVLAGHDLTKPEALSILEASDSQTFAIVEQAARIRQAHWGNRVRLYMLLNAKSGLCPEDCGYCSQSKDSTAPVSKYPFLTQELILQAAARASELGVHTFCIVNSGRGPTEKELNQVGRVVNEVKANYPLHICTCLGLLKDGQARFLKECGVDTYNHNLNTSREHYQNICSTHTFDDRVRTIELVKEAGIGTCSGGIVGMGESPLDVVDMAFELKQLGVHSVPVNFLNSIDGTPLENVSNLSPLKALRFLSLFRFVIPEADLRMAGGRELHLRSLQPFGLRVANSIFIGDYLTTKGQAPEADYQMIEDLGMVLERPTQAPSTVSHAATSLA